MLMIKNCSSSTTPRPSRQMAHKLDLGFHHYNLQQTSREAFAARPLGRKSNELLTTQVGGTVVRSLPTDGGSGFVDVPESGPTDPKSPRDIDEELLLAYGGQGSGVTGATQPPPQEISPSSGARGTIRGKSSQAGDTDMELVNAHWYPAMPSGDAAHNAAHCEPTPGDWPEGMAPQMAPADAVSPDEPLDAIHAMGAAHGTSHSGPVGGTSAGAARDDSSLPAHGQEMTLKQGNQQHSQQSSSSDTHAASRPADNPVEIKGVVRKETLADAPQGADTA